MDQTHQSLERGVNPLMQRVRIPGETFTLPSGGNFYTDGELSPEIENGEIHVHPMTAIDELVMKSLDKVFSGEAVKEVFERCIPGVLKPGQLSAKDVDFLLIALRKVSYGPDIDVTYTHDCENAEEHSYPVSLVTYIHNAQKVNPTTIKTTFSYKTESGQIVNFIPARYKDIVKLYQLQYADSNKERTTEEELRSTLTAVCAMIRDVDGIIDREQIIEWLTSLPILWLKEICDAASNTTNWGVKFEVDLVCKDCGKKISVPTPLNPISFFT